MNIQLKRNDPSINEIKLTTHAGGVLKITRDPRSPWFDLTLSRDLLSLSRDEIIALADYLKEMSDNG